MALYKKIVVNDRFYFEPYEYGFKLTEIKEGKKKVTHEKIEVENFSYYPKLSQVCLAILNKSADEAKSLKKVIKSIETSTEEILKAVAKVGKN